MDSLKEKTQGGENIMIMEWRKKPVVIKAVQYDGDNIDEIKEFAGDSVVEVFDGVYSIRTLEGKMMITKGDFIIQGINGEFYPCKPDIFYATYENITLMEDDI